MVRVSEIGAAEERNRLFWDRRSRFLYCALNASLCEAQAINRSSPTSFGPSSPTLRPSRSASGDGKEGPRKVAFILRLQTLCSSPLRRSPRFASLGAATRVLLGFLASTVLDFLGEYFSLLMFENEREDPRKVTSFHRFQTLFSTVSGFQFRSFFSKICLNVSSRKFKKHSSAAPFPSFRSFSFSLSARVLEIRKSELQCRCIEYEYKFAESLTLDLIFTIKLKPNRLGPAQPSNGLQHAGQLCGPLDSPQKPFDNDKKHIVNGDGRKHDALSPPTSWASTLTSGRLSYASVAQVDYPFIASNFVMKANDAGPQLPAHFRNVNRSDVEIFTTGNSMTGTIELVKSSSPWRIGTDLKENTESHIITDFFKFEQIKSANISINRSNQGLGCVDSVSVALSSAFGYPVTLSKQDTPISNLQAITCGSLLKDAFAARVHAPYQDRFCGCVLTKPCNKHKASYSATSIGNSYPIPPGNTGRSKFLGCSVFGCPASSVVGFNASLQARKIPD
ncbi:hypothetical protein MUK42_36881 [Musa troglodytarum]|uniref:Uncharacterized protein n=1 Tax=Musa troglodytarum TaxID=320322 RepID=A0A9E7G9Y2_9LILI|nr:hypothetical protein MUK42_36881 [Musa troglodytarum]